MSTASPSPPSLDSVLTSLRHHLLPSPLLSSLPSALTLFAHLQLLSRVVRSQATEALRVHDELVTRLAEEGVSGEEMVRRGILTRVERRQLKRWARRDEDDQMFGFSLELRKHHLAKLCTSPNIPLAAITSMIDTYFPSLPSASPQEFQTARDRHPMLFVRIMTSDQALVLGQYRSIARSWHGLLTKSTAARQGPLRIDEVTPGAPAQILEKLAEKMIKEAEAVIRDAGEFGAMFSRVGVGNTSGSLALDQVEEKRSIHSGPAKENRRASRSLHLLEDPADTPQHTLALAQPVPPASSEAGPSRPRASLPAVIRLRESLSPDPALDIPHLTFDTTRGGRLRARGSIERRSQTPLLRGDTPMFRRDTAKIRGSTPLFQPASPSPSPLDAGLDVGAQIDPTHFPEHPITGSAQSLGEPAGPGEGTGPGVDFDASIDTKPIIKKRRRVSGLPPETGPEYTASSPKQKAQAAPKSKLRPFESSQIVRPKRQSRGGVGGDENSPRAAKRAREEGREVREGLAEGDSQENSQEGVGPAQPNREMEVVEVVRKLDKGKGRAEPRGFLGQA